MERFLRLNVSVRIPRVQSVRRTHTKLRYKFNSNFHL